MNKNEMKMIEEMAKAMCERITKCKECLFNEYQYCIYHQGATALYNEGYRKVADDEIVLKQSEIDEFRKDQAEAKFLKDKIKKETAREILRLIYNRIKYKESANPPEIRIVKYAAKKYGIELGE